MVWMSACKQQSILEKLETSHNSSIQEKEEILSSMQSQLERAEQQATSRVAEAESALGRVSQNHALSQLHTLLATQRRAKEQSLFVKWWTTALREAYEQEKTDRVTAMQKQLETVSEEKTGVMRDSIFIITISAM